MIVSNVDTLINVAAAMNADRQFTCSLAMLRCLRLLRRAFECKHGVLNAACVVQSNNR